MFKKRSHYAVFAILAAVIMVVSACAPQATPEPTTAPAATSAQPAATEMTTGFSVGIVLPTKDEPRWIQDETRFKDALATAGYDVQILFSQGSSAKEKEPTLKR